MRPGSDVGDEQLLAGDEVVVAVAHARSSAGRSGRSRRPARSGRTPDSRSAARQFGQPPLLLLRGAERPHRIDRADAPVDATPGRRRSGRPSPSRVRNAAKLRERRRPVPPYFAVDEQPPVAGLGRVRPARCSPTFRFVVEQRAGVAVPADDRERLLHHRLGRRATAAGGGDVPQLARHLRVPDGPVDGAGGRLVPRPRRAPRPGRRPRPPRPCGGPPPPPCRRAAGPPRRTTRGGRFRRVTASGVGCRCSSVNLLVFAGARFVPW